MAAVSRMCRDWLAGRALAATAGSGRRTGGSRMRSPARHAGQAWRACCSPALAPCAAGADVGSRYPLSTRPGNCPGAVRRRLAGTTLHAWPRAGGLRPHPLGSRKPLIFRPSLARVRHRSAVGPLCGRICRFRVTTPGPNGLRRAHLSWSLIRQTIDLPRTRAGAAAPAGSGPAATSAGTMPDSTRIRSRIVRTAPVQMNSK
jgi:hypothetical protein